MRLGMSEEPAKTTRFQTVTASDISHADKQVARHSPLRHRDRLQPLCRYPGHRTDWVAAISGTHVDFRLFTMDLVDRLV